ncbi:MAG: hypothetical protein J6U26_05400 [Lachnospiraceae bacterium]|nr:hypothetical protein [Lachnospiraceae bacterium]
MAEKSTKSSAAAEAAKKAQEALSQKKSAPKTTKSDSAASTGKKKVEHVITEVDAKSGSKEELLEITRGNALPFRIGAIVCWVLAIGFEVLAILMFAKKLDFIGTWEIPGWFWILMLALDLVLLIVGSQLWKKANHLDPAPKKNAVRFWLQNNMGVLVAAVAFIPFVILALTDKNADKQSKTIAGIVAGVALLAGVLTGIDYNPVSQEELLEAAGVDRQVYWTDGGSVYHAYEDCSHLNNSVQLNHGIQAAAIEAGKTRLCKTCENRLEKEVDVEDLNKGDNSGGNEQNDGGNEELDPAA